MLSRLEQGERGRDGGGLGEGNGKESVGILRLSSNALRQPFLLSENDRRHRIHLDGRCKPCARPASRPPVRPASRPPSRPTQQERQFVHRKAQECEKEEEIIHQGGGAHLFGRMTEEHVGDFVSDNRRQFLLCVHAFLDQEEYPEVPWRDGGRVD